MKVDTTMASVSNMLARRIPWSASPLGLLPRSVFWKEMRQLRGLFWGVLALQCLGYLLLLVPALNPFLVNTAHTMRDKGDIERLLVTRIPLTVFLGGAAFLFAPLGALFFSTEQEDNTGAFLFRLPVSRRRLFWSKVSAALAIWGAMVIASFLLFQILRISWPALVVLATRLSPYAGARTGQLAVFVSPDPGGASVLWYAVAGFLAYSFCAFFSMRFANPLVAFLAGVSVFVATQMVLMVLLRWFLLGSPIPTAYLRRLGPGSEPSLLAAMNVPLCLVVGRAFWRRFSRMEEPVRTGAEGADSFWRLRISGRNAVSLGAAGRRTKVVFWGCFAVLAMVSFFFPYFREPLLLLLPVIGIVSGITLFSRPERDGAGFFLHFLPISRNRLFLQRVASNLALNLLFTAGVFALILMRDKGLHGLFGTTREYGSLSPDLAKDWCFLTGFPLAQFAGFLIGAMICTLTRTYLTAFVESLILTSLITLPTVAMWTLDLPFFLYAVALILGFLLFLAWWNFALSRAMEPGVRKGWRLVLFGGAGVVWALLVNLIDPLDLLYLIGIDVYGWL